MDKKIKNNEMNCRICNSECKKKFEAEILNKYNISYLYCKNCGFLQTEKPFWLKESYEESMNLSDTGILLRNMRLAKISSVILYFLFRKNKKFLDYAGGYGIFTRLMRDVGFDFYWKDPYTKNILARGFEYDESMKIELLTSFESFEHFANPLEDIEKMLKISKNILFTTDLLPAIVPKPEKWWYYGLEHGQHISFYSRKTLKFIAKKYNFHLYSFGNTHLLSEKKFPVFIFYGLIFLSDKGLGYMVRKIMKGGAMDDMRLLIARNKR